MKVDSCVWITTVYNSFNLFGHLRPYCFFMLRICMSVFSIYFLQERCTYTIMHCLQKYFTRKYVTKCMITWFYLFCFCFVSGVVCVCVFLLFFPVYACFRFLHTFLFVCCSSSFMHWFIDIYAIFLILFNALLSCFYWGSFLFVNLW